MQVGASNVFNETKERLATHEWLQHFTKNSMQRLAIPWERGIQLEPVLLRPLIRSFQRFQVGEQGDGIHLKRSARKTKNFDYIRAIELFIAEEQEHSRLLARFIQALDYPLIASHWSDTCFVFLRRLLGLQTELLVLLVAEIIAQVYYRIIRDGTNDIVLQSLCNQILHDEDGHVAFHCDHLHPVFKTYSPFKRWLISSLWRIFFSLVCLIVLFDHRSLISAVAVSPQQFWQECHQAFQNAHDSIFV